MLTRPPHPTPLPSPPLFPKFLPASSLQVTSPLGPSSSPSSSPSMVAAILTSRFGAAGPSKYPSANLAGDAEVPDFEPDYKRQRK